MKQTAPFAVRAETPLQSKRVFCAFAGRWHGSRFPWEHPRRLLDATCNLHSVLLWSLCRLKCAEHGTTTAISLPPPPPTPIRSPPSQHSFFVCVRLWAVWWKIKSLNGPLSDSFQFLWTKVAWRQQRNNRAQPDPGLQLAKRCDKDPNTSTNRPWNFHPHAWKLRPTGSEDSTNRQWNFHPQTVKLPPTDNEYSTDRRWNFHQQAVKLPPIDSETSTNRQWIFHQQTANIQPTDSQTSTNRQWRFHQQWNFHQQAMKMPPTAKLPPTYSDTSTNRQWNFHQQVV